jgi:hypothetical protein
MVRQTKRGENPDLMQRAKLMSNVTTAMIRGHGAPGIISSVVIALDRHAPRIVPKVCGSLSQRGARQRKLGTTKERCPARNA